MDRGTGSLIDMPLADVLASPFVWYRSTQVPPPIIPLARLRAEAARVDANASGDNGRR
jgi:hypothetical protein